jgi:thioredoxin-like negative regulator of GroEL
MSSSSSLRAVLVALALGGAACSSSSAGGTAPAVAVQGARLVFFMNPAGAPCQQQDQVIRAMAPELTGKVSVVYLRTTEPTEIPFFERFGIRSLPQLVLVDGAGNEVRRATPGIQDPAAIRLLVGI